MQQKTGVFFLIVVVLGAGAWLLTRPNPAQSSLRIREIAARGLAEEIVRGQPSDSRVLVLSNPFTQRPDIAKAIAELEQAGVAGVREGLGTQLALGAVAFPELKPEALQNPVALLADVETSTPLSFLVTPEAFDKASHEHRDCTVLISLIGLPAELNQCAAWKASSPVKFALLLPDFRNIAESWTILQAVKSGKLVAFVLPKPGAPDNNVPVAGDWKSEFERRFVLVTAANVEQVVQGSPTLF